MLRALRLVWSLARIPHVALTLFVFPTLLSLALVFVQIVLTGVVIKSLSTDTKVITQSIRDGSARPELRILRNMLYGSPETRPALRVCFWVPDSESDTGERPPSPECYPDRLDVAVNVENPSVVEVSKIKEIFEGEVDRVHVCRSCQPDATISIGNDGKPHTKARSIYGLGVVFLALTKRDTKRLENRAMYLESVGEFQEAVGSTSFFVPEAGAFVDLSPANPFIPLTINVVLIVMIAVWLALRAHRKVLEYFSQNGVLLPLVAATGKRPFYGAVWLLTLLRVSCFLLGSVPMLLAGMEAISGEDVFQILRPQAPMLAIWALSLVATLGFLTTVASMADLRHRDTIFAFLYRYLPFTVAVAGAAVWVFSFIFVADWSASFRLIIGGTPMVGLLPLLMAPVLQLPNWVVAVHGGAAAVALFLLLRRNSTWFAAHLEEV